MPDQVRVFVSHHHSPAEDAFTTRLAADLKAVGADVWVDEERIISGNFVHKISEGLTGRQWLVLVMTPDALRSPWVQQEVDAALHQFTAGRMRGVIPVVAAPCDEPEIPMLWATLQRYDATSDYQSALTGLLTALGLASALASQPAAVGTPPLPVSALPPHGPTPMPVGATPVLHLTTATLYNLGFRGWVVGGVECVLPPLCPVPSGVFTMGSNKTRDKEARDDEIPQHLVQVGDFALGQHPVTVAEYACAVRAKAVGKPQDTLTIKQAGGLLSGLKRAALGLAWQEQLKRLDHPVVAVSWDQALAYARWLVHVTGQSWRLPTEAEWEKAARGTDGRIYPWGDAFDNEKCDTRESSVDQATTAVGMYPTGASPYEVLDMAGTISQWTSSLYKPYPYNMKDGREDLKLGPGMSLTSILPERVTNILPARVIRGGGPADAPHARAASRGHDWPGDYLFDRGFRLAWSPAGIA